MPLRDLLAKPSSGGDLPGRAAVTGAAPSYLQTGGGLEVELLAARSAAAAPPPGLVDKETSPVSSADALYFRGESCASIFKGLARSKRLGRMRRTVSAFADAAYQGLRLGGRRTWLLMVTLTYAPGWEFESGHISDYVQRLTEWLDRRDVPHAYAWVIEMQKRGVPHYHVLVWLPEGQRLPRPDRPDMGLRKPMWSFGMSRVEVARSVGYIVKYASKGDGSPLPVGVRLFGVGGSERAWRRVARWFALPSWLRSVSAEGDVFKRCKEVGWVNTSTGDIHVSDWKCEWGRDAEGSFVRFVRWVR